MYDPTITREEAAEFLGRPVASLPPNFEIKTKLATLLLKLATCRTEFPDDALSNELVKAAVIYMAQDMSLRERFEKEAASPFQSETIGSYSYSKMLGRVQTMESTEVLWFDTAVDNLSLCGLSNLLGGSSASGGYSVFENDFPAYNKGDGTTVILAPRDIEFMNRWV